MAVQRAATARRWQPRVVVQLVMLMVAASLLAITTVQLWRTTGDDLNVATAERDGVAYLRPLSGLVAELADAQATAVRGGAVQSGAVSTAVDAVESADRRYGESLAVHKWWTDTKKSITDLMAAKPIGPSAFDQYGEVLGLVQQLVRQIADASQLVLDTDIGSSYLVDTAVNRLPEVIVGVGRAADLAVLAPAAGGDPTLTRIMVARYNVAVATDAIGSGLAKSLDASDSRTLGTNVTGNLDAFRSAVDAFVPSGTRLRSLDQTDATTLTRTATAVRETARPLFDAVLGELDRLLQSRVDSLGWRRGLAVGGTFLGLLLVLAVLGMVLLAARTPVPAAARTRIPGGADAPPTQRARPDTRVIDPHDLRAMEAMLHAGQPGRTGLRERDGNAG